jgi:hypothetical protein
MSKISKILEACDIFSRLVKKADYSADITDGKKALNNLKSVIEGLDIESFRRILEEENDEYRYLPGRLMGDKYKDCRVQFQYKDEPQKEDKFINFEIVNRDDYEDYEAYEDDKPISTPIGPAILQDGYDLELILDIDSFSSHRNYLFSEGRTRPSEFFEFKIEEGAEEDEYINDLDEAYLIGLKKAIIKACSKEQPAFYHEVAHLRRMRKQNPIEFIKQWNPSKSPNVPLNLMKANFKTDTELYPQELERFSNELRKLINEFNLRKSKRDPSWEELSFLDFLDQIYDMRSKHNFITSMKGRMDIGLGFYDEYDDYSKSAIKRISKFYDDMVAGKFKDTLGI